jgi:hypothetical protein
MPEMSTRELDAEVAEKVMGWTRPVDSGSVAGLWGLPDAAGSYVTESNVPRYSTDWGHAWSVVEKIHQMGRMVTIRVMHDGFVIEIGTMRDDDFTQVPGVTFPETMCNSAIEFIGKRAALMAKEGK